MSADLLILGAELLALGGLVALGLFALFAGEIP